jgi:hypothetical protein
MGNGLIDHYLAFDIAISWGYTGDLLESKGNMAKQYEDIHRFTLNVIY